MFTFPKGTAPGGGFIQSGPPPRPDLAAHRRALIARMKNTQRNDNTESSPMNEFRTGSIGHPARADAAYREDAEAAEAAYQRSKGLLNAHRSDGQEYGAPAATEAEAYRRSVQNLNAHRSDGHHLDDLSDLVERILRFHPEESKRELEKQSVQYLSARLRTLEQSERERGRIEQEQKLKAGVPTGSATAPHSDAAYREDAAAAEAEAYRRSVQNLNASRIGGNR